MGLGYDPSDTKDGLIYLNAKETQPFSIHLFLPHGSHEANFLIIFSVSAHLEMICRKMVLLTISNLSL